MIQTVPLNGGSPTWGWVGGTEASRVGWSEQCKDDWQWLIRRSIIHGFGQNSKSLSHPTHTFPSEFSRGRTLLSGFISCTVNARLFTV